MVFVVKLAGFVVKLAGYAIVISIILMAIVLCTCILVANIDDINVCKDAGVQEFWLNVWHEADEGHTFYYYDLKIIPRDDGGLTIRKEVD